MTQIENREPGLAGGILFFILLAMLWIYYVVYDGRSDIKELRYMHYELKGDVSSIQIKGDDVANQLMLSIEKQYWAEINRAIDIAYEAGYGEHKKVVFINPNLNIVRLSSPDGTEIQVNIISKTITTYSPL